MGMLWNAWEVSREENILEPASESITAANEGVGYESGIVHSF